MNTQTEKKKRSPRRTFSGKFKAKVAVIALKGKKKLTEIAKKFHVAVAQVCIWKKELIENSEKLFILSFRKKVHN